MTTAQFTAVSLVGLELFVGIGAVLGGAASIAAPDTGGARFTLSLFPD